MSSLWHCSQDINNTATPMLMRDAIHRSYIPSMEALVEALKGKLPDWDMPMLAKTHGQPASPTNLAKEFKVRMLEGTYLDAILE